MGVDFPAPPNPHPATDGGEAAPASFHPNPPWAPAAPSSGLPPIADKADDLEAIKKAVDDAAAVGGGLWLSYLFVLFYLAIAVGAVTHADLFFENPVKLPFLNIELPLLAFFFLAPLLFLVVHAYALVHLVMLTDKAKRYHQALYDQIGDKAGLSREELEERKRTRDGLRRQLPSNVFVEFLAGPSDVRDSAFGYLLRAIAWVTLVVAPVLLLLMMQIQFPPFHSSFIAWTQRAALLGDLVLIWWLWRKILSGRIPGRWFGPSSLWSIVGLAFTLGAFLFSWTVATFPGESQEERLATWRSALVSHASEQADVKPSEPPRMSLAATFRDRAAPFWNWVLTKEASLHDGIFNSEVDPTTRRRWLPFSSTLVLPGLNVYEGLGIDDPEKIKGRDFVFRARGRDLNGAIFDLASMPKVDFEGAELVGSSLFGAQLQGASLKKANLRGAFLDHADLEGASLEGAQLRAASLIGAHLQGVSLNCEDLVHDSGCMQLQGAWLEEAQLQAASLEGAHLEGASLQNTQLQGASLVDAHLQGAYLAGARLEGASLDRADLRGAWLSVAQLQAASLEGSQLQGAWLQFAGLQGSSLQRAVLQATDLSGTNFWRTNRGAWSTSEVTQPKAIRLTDAPEWQPVAYDVYHEEWNHKSYQGLLKMIELLPLGALRDKALGRIARFDCANPNPTLASCDPPLAHAAS